MVLQCVPQTLHELWWPPLRDRRALSLIDQPERVRERLAILAQPGARSARVDQAEVLKLIAHRFHADAEMDRKPEHVLWPLRALESEASVELRLNTALRHQEVCSKRVAELLGAAAEIVDVSVNGHETAVKDVVCELVPERKTLPHPRSGSID